MYGDIYIKNYSVSYTLYGNIFECICLNIQLNKWYNKMFQTKGRKRWILSMHMIFYTDNYYDYSAPNHMPLLLLLFTYLFFIVRNLELIFLGKRFGTHFRPLPHACGIQLTENLPANSQRHIYTQIWIICYLKWHPLKKL